MDIKTRNGSIEFDWERSGPDKDKLWVGLDGVTNGAYISRYDTISLIYYLAGELGVRVHE